MSHSYGAKDPLAYANKDINKDDRLALFGYGLFETLRVEGEHIEVPKLHYERMSKGAELLGLSMSDYEVWLAGIQDVVEGEKRDSSYALRVTLSGGAGQELPPQWLYHLRPIPYTGKDSVEGLPIIILSHPRNESSPLVRIKSTNYMENILAKKEAEQKGAREGIWLNTKGYLVEGTMSNLFFVKEGVLYTPSLECGCLAGTRREVVLECAWILGIPYVEGEFGLECLKDAEEVFLTNALMGVMPVSKVEQQRIPVKTNLAASVHQRIQDCYKRFL